MVVSWDCDVVTHKQKNDKKCFFVKSFVVSMASKCIKMKLDVYIYYINTEPENKRLEKKIPIEHHRTTCDVQISHAFVGFLGLP